MSNVTSDRPIRHTEYPDRQRLVPTDLTTTAAAAGPRLHAPAETFSWE